MRMRKRDDLWREKDAYDGHGPDSIEMVVRALRRGADQRASGVARLRGAAVGGPRPASGCSVDRSSWRCRTRGFLRCPSDRRLAGRPGGSTIHRRNRGGRYGLGVAGYALATEGLIPIAFAAAAVSGV